MCEEAFKYNFRTGIHEMLIIIANRKNPDPTVSSEVVCEEAV